MNTTKIKFLSVFLLITTVTGMPAMAGNSAQTDSLEMKMPELMFRTDAVTSTAAISGMTGETAGKTPATDISNTFYGNLQGLTVMEGSGQIGNDAAIMSIRGKGTFNDDDFAIYVDGFETDMSYVSNLLPSEIEKVYVLKDAAALSIFGMKGANGVLWIETRRGHIGKPSVGINVRTGFQQPVGIVKPLGSAEYASLYNEAASNDNGRIWTPYYTPDQINAYAAGQGIDIDWYDEVLRDTGMMTSTDVTVSGGNDKVKYFTMLGYTNRNGFWDIRRDDTMSNSSMDRYSFRTNIDFTAFKIFEGKVDIGGNVLTNSSPNYSEDQLWYNLSTYPNNIYEVYDGNIHDNEHFSGTATHPDNPVASMKGIGYKRLKDRTFQANFSLKERLDFITPGLYLQEMASFSTWTRGTYTVSRDYSRLIDGAAQTASVNSDYSISDDRGTNQWTWYQFKAQAGYDRTFGKHAVNAAVNYEQYKRYVDADMNSDADIQTTYAHQAINGRFHYTYDNRYSAEIGFSWSGSDNFNRGYRFRFYPTVSFAWIMSNERFLKDSRWVDLLKIRASAGMTGYDMYSGGRYLYFQYYVNGNSFPTGNAGDPLWNSSIIPAYIADPGLTAETSTKYNIGIDGKFLGCLQFTFDAYLDKRSGIITTDNSYPAAFGVNPPYSNIGKVTSGGIEASLFWDRTFGKVRVNAGGMLAWNRNVIDYMAEIPAASPYARQTGNAVGSIFGYRATGFYDISDFDDNGNLREGIPYPTFGQVQPGDVRYDDINGDKVIDEQDKIKIGDSFPSLYWSVTAGVAYAGFDFRIVFQGAGGYDINLLDAASKTIAFRDNSTVYPIARDRWAYYPDQGIDTRETASYPRLSTGDNTNNYQNSTLWMRKGRFMKVRNIEIGYTIPEKAASKAKLAGARVYINAVNPFQASPVTREFGLNPEQMTGSPSVKSWNIGLSLQF